MEKKTPFAGFSAAGISDQAIADASRFGLAIKDGLDSDKEKAGLPLVTGLRAAEVDVSLVQSEKVGFRSFRIWGKLLRKIGPQGSAARKPVLVVYVLFLILMIVTVVPITMLLKKILSPLLTQHYSKIKQKYEKPSGSGSERMGQS